MGYVDAVGAEHPVAASDARIVSLVPSVTELLCDLGLASQLVGRTGFCIHPREVVRSIPKVGGTKDVAIDRIRELAPTHVVVNVDENTKETVAELQAFVPSIVVTHPLSPEDNLGLYRLLGGIFGRAPEAERLCDAFSVAYADLTSAARPPAAVLYLIWRDPWMTVSRDTYISRTLALVGWETFPAGAGDRYPEVDLVAAAACVDRVLALERAVPLPREAPRRGRGTRARRTGDADRRRDDVVVRQQGDRRAPLPRRLRAGLRRAQEERRTSSRAITSRWISFVPS